MVLCSSRSQRTASHGGLLLSISKASVWQGGMVATYEDEIHAWIKEDQEDWLDIERYDLSKVNETGFDWDLSPISDASLFFSPKILLILDHLEELRAEQVNILGSRLSKMDTDFHVAIIQRNGNRVLKGVMDILTEEVYERFVPFGDMKEQTRWIIDWLDAHDVGVSKGDAEGIAHHSSEDPTIMVRVVTSLVASSRGFDIGWKDIEPVLGELGAFDVWSVMNAIEKGNRSDAIECLIRNRRVLAPRELMAAIKKKYRMYGLCLDTPLRQKDMAEKLEANYYVVGYAMKAASTLGLERLTKSLEVIANADHLIGVRFGDGDEEQVIESAVLQLAQQFYLARRKS